MHLPYLAGTLLAGLAQASPAEVPPRQSETMLKVDMDIRKLNQRIDGFGFSEAFQRANNIVNLPEEKRAALVDLLFNKTSGAGFTILRNGIGSSPDSSLDWMNTILPQSPGSPDAEPAYVWDGNDSGQLWVAQQAVKYGVETFYADAWSAPGFMKTNGKDSGGGYLCGSPGQKCSSGDWRQAYANYLVKLVQFYAESGVNITHLGFLNEPDMSTSYASMLMDGNQAADFIKILHPTLKKNNLSDVQIACCDATGWKAQQQITRDMVAAGAEPLLGVVTGHTYSSGISGTQPTSLRVWETECSDLKGHWSTAWDSDGGAGDGLTWAMNIYTGLTTGNVSAYLWWVGTQDPATNNNNNEKLVLVDKDTYTVSKRLWAFAQYSRTVRPGAWRLDMLNDASNLKTTAFRNKDLTMAVNIINTGASATPVVISNTLIPARSAQAWVTDNTRDMDAVEVTVSSDGTVGGLSVPARSMVSLIIGLASGPL